MPTLPIASQEIFAQNVARGKTQVDAYVIAGYQENDSNACTLANRPEVAARIQEIIGVIAARAQVSGERVLAELARIGFSDITQAVKIKGGKVLVADTDALPRDLRAAISEISQGRDGLKVKMHDKRAALESLGKHLGLWKENVDLNVNVSLIDLVNGSFKLEQGQVIEAKAEPA
jgi:phage terminase small subunit